MSENLYIYHHLGMGDHILCNGLVRTYAEKHPKVFLFSKPQNVKNVAYMYRDLPKIKIIGMNDADVKFFMQVNPDNNYLVVGITADWFRRFNNREFGTFDQGFYTVANVPLEDKWNKFFFQRELETEKEAFYNKLGLKDNEEFIFVHDNPEQGRNFKKTYLPSGIKIIKPGDYKDIGLFDFLFTIEKAKEVHVMNSSFMNLIDTMQLRNHGIFMHEYARTDMGDNPNPKLKLNWTILK